jgi:hypothetical protein
LRGPGARSSSWGASDDDLSFESEICVERGRGGPQGGKNRHPWTYRRRGACGQLERGKGWPWWRWGQLEQPSIQIPIDLQRLIPNCRANRNHNHREQSDDYESDS